eukprot:CAMPEP_0202713664 /NCGR_PEP_ID=MMETSP1385-20130828/57578_1 /ASSEMBLY_ACC=CAM_ASM_000861 /TAXON_ID=933848 /ORGANISM="Elphidium margaritaceum" /LENGTH=475 /DNA_ID=CAMNT_0049374085 /DNA_START=19 /DNA_END=1446 /DNA_ORIENTATION=-
MAKHSTLNLFSSIFNSKNQWCLLLTFALFYCTGFILFFPLRYENNDPHHELDDGVRGSKQNEQHAWPEVVELATNIAPWRIVENNKSHLINQNENLSQEFIPLKDEWGTKYLTRVLCLIPTLWPDRKEKMDIIAKTYGKGCTKLMWVVDEEQNAPTEYNGHETLIISLQRTQNNEKHVRNIWEKVHRMWTTVYQTPSLIDNFEWFIKADDDTFIATENLFGFLQYYDSSYPHYVGHSIRSRWQSENVVFNSGICYILSRATIKKIGKYQQHLPSLYHTTGRSHCIDRDGAGEDPTTGICLLGVGIRPDNTLDHNLRERFLIFRDTDHQKIFREDTWFWKYKPDHVGEGMQCCSPYLISMHNYKSVKDAQRFFPVLMEQYNQPKDWDNIILPPQPRLFLYDKTQIDFEIDAYRNVLNPPKGQRIYKGPDKEWICHNCEIGKSRDPFWTEWWDGTQNEPSQHVNDAYSPIKQQDNND